MKMWLDANPHVAHDSDCFVTTLAQTSAGIPFQIYCFTATSKWFPYEAIQATIFEQVAAMLRFFQLYAFENPSGRDTVIDGYLSPGGDIDKVYGIPYPFSRIPMLPTVRHRRERVRSRSYRPLRRLTLTALPRNRNHGIYTMMY